MPELPQRPPEAQPQRLPHLFAQGTAESSEYRSPRSAPHAPPQPNRDRQAHGTYLRQRLDEAWGAAAELASRRAAVAIDTGQGYYFEFRGAAEFHLTIESLENRRKGIEVVGVRVEDDIETATVFVPEQHFRHFLERLEEYLTRETRSGAPKNAKLINSVSDVRLAVLESFWTDDRGLLPTADQLAWWEVWLREDKLEAFRSAAQPLGLRLGNQTLTFIDRTVVLVYGSREQLQASVELLDCIAELRKPKETAEPYLAMSGVEQEQWVDDLLRRLNPPPPNAPAVLLLDRGLAHTHRLLAPAVDPADVHTFDPRWGTNDNGGHGTKMAGLCLYGDFQRAVASMGPISLSHHLETVKILPPTGANPPDLYGAITQSSIDLGEARDPNRRRSICMAVTSTDFRDRGQPTSWSAAVDQACFGSNGGNKRLMLISGGNVDWNVPFYQYPNTNMIEGLHDPGQAWNALTVGAYTELVTLQEPHLNGCRTVAPQGGLCPGSSTSLIWEKQWPIKPDIVMEGGNLAIDHNGDLLAADSLQLLTTHHMHMVRPFSSLGDTSAATALAARMGTQIQAAYPRLWPETVRALIVHSADWTDEMQRQFVPLATRQQREQLLRWYGYGVPDLHRALWSAQNELTLVVQEQLQPFERNQMKDMHFHQLPWPKDALLALGDAEVEMRVTLSYFVEPNPSRRGWRQRHRYQSHGLRFDVKTPTESLAEFRQRLNRMEWDEDTDTRVAGDEASWFLGPLRRRGSLHSDWWTGSAAELAQRGYLAVYPIVGWWRERHQLGRWQQHAPYALVISLRTPATNVDIYTPVATMVNPQIRVQI